MFIDGSYEGDLMAKAHVRYRIGREGQEEYGEWSAPPEGDNNLQGYNFRLIMTQDPANRVMPEAPRGYRRELFLDLIPLMESGRIRQVFGGPFDRDNVLKAQIPVLPNGKRDINDASGDPPVYMSLPGVQRAWPEGDADVRQRIYDEHVIWNVGMIYFMQNDPAMPEALRAEARTWGFCRDEFEENGHIPPQIYVREGRRTVGMRIFTQHDTRYAPDDARAVLPGHPDFVAVQWWGTAGGLHGLAPPPSRPGQRGRRIEGQHGEATPDHEAHLDMVLETELAGRWTDLARQLGIDIAKLPHADGNLTRGEWIRAAHLAAR